MVEGTGDMELDKALKLINNKQDDIERKMMVLLDPFLSLKTAFDGYRTMTKSVIESLAKQLEELNSKQEEKKIE
jgi:hypothetical protein